MASAKKELKEIVKAAEEQGWRVKTTKRGHSMFLAPDGINKVTAGGTPSDHRAVANLLGDLRRYGFKWKGR
jgi:predicted RNA binding protein YcfA (HicA-like mRNA interferase family)